LRFLRSDVPTKTNSVAQTFRNRRCAAADEPLFRSSRNQLHRRLPRSDPIEVGCVIKSEKVGRGPLVPIDHITARRFKEKVQEKYVRKDGLMLECDARHSGKRRYVYVS
jgi:hypothetical protein